MYGRVCVCSDMYNKREWNCLGKPVAGVVGSGKVRFFLFLIFFVGFVQGTLSSLFAWTFMSLSERVFGYDRATRSQGWVPFFVVGIVCATVCVLKIYWWCYNNKIHAKCVQLKFFVCFCSLPYFVVAIEWWQGTTQLQKAKK